MRQGFPRHSAEPLGLPPEPVEHIRFKGFTVGELSELLATLPAKHKITVYAEVDRNDFLSGHARGLATTLVVVPATDSIELRTEKEDDADG